MSPKLLITATLAALALAAAGCSWLSTPFKAQQIREAQAANRECESQHLYYPSYDYVQCRLKIAEKQQQRQYEALNMNHSGAGTEPEHDMGVYKPIDDSKFGCHRETEDDGRQWIRCGEGQ